MQILRDVRMTINEADNTDQADEIKISYYTIGGKGTLILYPEALLPCTNKRLKAIMKMFQGAWSDGTREEFLTYMISQCLYMDETYDNIIEDYKDADGTTKNNKELAGYMKRKAQLQKNYKFLKERRDKNDYC